MRQTIKSLSPIFGFVLVLAGGQSAGASIIASSVSSPTCQNAGSNGCAAGPSYVTGDGAGGTIYTVNFNDGTAVDPNGVATYSGGIGIDGASAPGGDSTHYLDVNSTSVTITFSVAVNYFGLYWGSGDGYNSVHFYNGGTDIADFIGGSGESYVSYNAVGETFDKIVLTSTSCCFETDNHAYVIAGASDAPEPGTMTTAATILVGLPVYMVWRRRRTQAIGVK